MIQRALAPVRQHPASDESKCEMHNGMSVLLRSLLYPFHPLHSVFWVSFLTQRVVNNLDDRTHRQRTQNYIKTLESEVIRLRDSEGDLTQANKKLQNQVDLLRTALIVGDVPLPPGIEGSSQSTQPTSSPFDMPATVAFKTDNANRGRLHITWPDPPPPQPVPQQQTQSRPEHFTQAFERSFTPTVDHFSGDWCGSNYKPLPHLPKGISTPSASHHQASS